MIIGLAVVVVVASVFIAAYVFFKDRQDDGAEGVAVAAGVCGDDLISRANTIISDNNLTDFASLQSEIESKNDHANDINCEYISARYYIATGQKDNAESSVETIEKLKASGAVYSDYFSPSAISVEELKSTVESIGSASFELDIPAEPSGE